MTFADILGLSVSLIISIIAIFDLWRLDTSAKNKYFFALILILPILGLACYLLARPGLAKIKHDSRINNIYAKGEYELHNNRLKELREIKRLQSEEEREEIDQSK